MVIGRGKIISQIRNLDTKVLLFFSVSHLTIGKNTANVGAVSKASMTKVYLSKLCKVKCERCTYDFKNTLSRGGFFVS